MLSPWLTTPEADATDATTTVEAWSQATGLDLRRLGTTADAAEIRDTGVTQPLVVVAALLAYQQLTRRVSLPSDTAVAGHSVGELAAAAIAGVLTPDSAVRLAAVRGREMAAACALAPTGMSAVLGGEPEQVLRRLDELGLDPANRNGAGQVVAAGPTAALKELAAEPPERARVVPLPVAGAFHTRFMAPAETALRAHAHSLTVADPTRALLSNADGRLVSSGTDVVHRLVAQVTRPVRWDRCMATLQEMGVRAVIELPPAGALTGLVKRELKGVKTLAVNGPDDLDVAAELIDEHRGVHQNRHGPESDQPGSERSGTAA